MLDVVATTDPAHSVLTLAVINRDLEEAHTTTIQFANATIVNTGVVYEVNGPDVRSMNSFENPSVVTVQERPLEPVHIGQPLTYTFPAHSLTILRLNLG
jgi:alpha-N-arabinofuranosidase